MKKVSLETNYNVVQEIGKLFDLKVVGIKKEELVNQINAKIEELKSAQAPKAGKWYENTELAYNENDVVEVVSGWAEGRKVQIVKPSAKVNAFKGYLLDKKTNEPQGTLVTVDEADIKPYVETKVEEVKEEAEAV